MQAQTAEKEETSYLDDIFQNIQAGKLILVDFGEKKSLMWFEKYESYTRKSGWSRVNRHCSVPSWNRRLADGRRVRKVTTSCIFGTHRLDLNMDPEFEVFLPSSHDRDIFLEVAYHLEDGTIEILLDPPRIYTEMPAIQGRIEAIVRPKYFLEVVEPFMGAKSTRFQMPRWKKRRFRIINIQTLRERFEKETRGG